MYWRPVPGQPQLATGQGSGVIIDTEGHILTSHHVIEGADNVKVVLADGTAFDAEIVGEDPHTDIGVIKIKGLGDYPVVPIEPGDSDALRVGEFVVAVGSPFHLNSSVTMGIVSQKGRTVGVLPYEDFIQTDASINPGNSGGPLVDLEGRMIGINAVIQTDGSRGSIGIGFAVPGNRAFKIANVLKSGGAVERPWLGIYPEPMSVAAARRYAGRNAGVYIAEVFRNTPAYKSGLDRGDIILDINGEPIYSVLDLQREVFKNDIGETIRVSVLRASGKAEFEVRTEQMPDTRMFK
jgi:serine protease Do